MGPRNVHLGPNLALISGGRSLEDAQGQVAEELEAPVPGGAWCTRSTWLRALIRDHLGRELLVRLGPQRPGLCTSLPGGIPGAQCRFSA